MIIARTVAQLREHVRAARSSGATIALVPTMGALHKGHLSLIAQASTECDFVVVSLFVNPSQFNEAADLERYPRDEARDASLCEGAGAQLLFAPSVAEVYPTGFMTTVEVSALAAPLEGVVRGTSHFRGVATVVTKLLNMAQPDAAFFGQKDAQQALIIKRLARDLDLPARIVICPTVREPDGLAMSSRNVLLDDESRRRAPVLSRALFATERVIGAGATSSSAALAEGQALLASANVEPEYFVAVSAETLEAREALEGEVLIAIAARFGAVRLIDNVVVRVKAK